MGICESFCRWEKLAPVNQTQAESIGSSRKYSLTADTWICDSAHRQPTSIDDVKAHCAPRSAGMFSCLLNQERSEALNSIVFCASFLCIQREMLNSMASFRRLATVVQ